MLYLLSAQITKMDKKEELFCSRIQDLANTAYSRGIVTFTGFLSLNELHMVNSRNVKELGVTPESFGGYELAERQIAAFIPDALSYELHYPISCIRIINKGAKFSQKLTHRDYLGALINLGIDRSTLGDIIVRPECAYLFCLERMTDFILENLCRVRHTNVLPELVDEPGEFPGPEFEKVTGTVSSLRLDSILAVAFKASRSSLVHEIETGNCFVNGKMITSNGYSIKEHDIISLRGKGKFQFLETTGQTKKGRCSVTLNRYV